MAHRPQVNPFYIEPAKRAAWEEDAYETVDEVELEGEFLLPSNQPHRQQFPHDASSSYRRRRRGRHVSPRANRQLVCIFTAILIILLLLLSSRSSSNNNTSASAQEPSSHQTHDTAADHPQTHAPSIAPSVVQLPIPPTSKPPTATPSLAPVGHVATNSPTAAPVATTTKPTIMVVATSSPSNAPVTTDSNLTETNPPVQSNSDRSNGTDVDELVLVGLQHSGLSWYQQNLQACYPNRSVSTYLSRETIWFQDPPSSLGADGPMPRRLIVLVARNVYDWVDAMRRYTPLDVPSSWMDFVQHPWKPPGPIINEDSLSVSNVTTCQYGFTPQQVVPCNPVIEESNTTMTASSPSVDSPTFELDADGNVFANVLKLRAAKLRHFRDDVPQWWSSALSSPPTIILPYEQGPTLAMLDEFTGWSHSTDAACHVQVPPDDLDQAVTHNYTDAELEYLRTHVNWEEEKRIGYEPR